MNNFQKTLTVLTEGDSTDQIKVVIEKDKSTKEYRVPAPNGKEAGAYYTDDRQDAVDTAKDMYKKQGSINITFKSVEEFVGSKYTDKKAKKPAPKKKPAVKKK